MAYNITLSHLASCVYKCRAECSMFNMAMIKIHICFYNITKIYTYIHVSLRDRSWPAQGLMPYVYIHQPPAIRFGEPCNKYVLCLCAFGIRAQPVTVWNQKWKAGKKRVSHLTWLRRKVYRLPFCAAFWIVYSDALKKKKMASYEKELQKIWKMIWIYANIALITKSRAKLLYAAVTCKCITK